MGATLRALTIIAAVLLGQMLAWSAQAQPIDRRALVTRHNIELTRIDPDAPLMLGNGDLGFTADITGLQTFPEQYSPHSPLLTMAQWAWHTNPNPNHYTEADGEVLVDVPGRGRQPYAWMRAWTETQTRPALAWLRENPHRFSLGRIALALTKRDGSAARFDEISAVSQRLDLWSGALSSRFVFDGEPVTVETRVHAVRDMVLVQIRSPLVARGRLGIDVRYPGVSQAINGDPSDWTRDDRHTTTIVRQQDDRMLLRRQLDETIYYSGVFASGARITKIGAHQVHIVARSGDRLTVLVSFARTEAAAAAPANYGDAVANVTSRWQSYWRRGGMIDFSGSTDWRASELERRVVLSQYLERINGAGEYPPQEEGLFSNSWFGKFHLEVHALHAAHFAQWGRPDLVERSLGWYTAELPRAQAEARRHGVEGAWWPKMTGPGGVASPSVINPFIMWQQPHPIYMAELVYRAKPNAETLAHYNAIVEETAKLLSSWPRWDAARRQYMLGPPIIPAQENHDPLTTVNPVFEVEYFRWALQTAQLWRERRGLARDPNWDRIITSFAPSPQSDGVYLPVESEPDFWRNTMSATCSGHANGPPCRNADHASFLMAYGMIGADRIDVEAMRRTLRATEAHWDTRQLWGWDFPIIAMTAARLGEPDAALAWLFRDEQNNHWGVSGMTPRYHLEQSPAGASYRPDANTYFPSNGTLLLAVGMMAAGWDGSSGEAPGFPRTGWRVRVEGIGRVP